MDRNNGQRQPEEEMNKGTMRDGQAGDEVTHVHRETEIDEQAWDVITRLYRQTFKELVER